MRNRVDICDEIQIFIKKGKIDISKIDDLFGELDTDLDDADKNQLILGISEYNLAESHIREGILKRQESIHHSRFVDNVLNLKNKIKKSEKYRIDAEIKQKEILSNLEKAQQENKKIKDKQEVITKENVRLKKGVSALILLSIIGIILTGFIIISIQYKKEHISLIGSGSVYNFIRKNRPDLFKNDIQSKIFSNVVISPVESASNAAKNVVKSSYQRGEFTSKELLSIIGMSSSSIKEDFENDTSSLYDSSSLYYALKFGEDPLKVNIGWSKKNKSSNLQDRLRNQVDIGTQDLKSLISSKYFSIYATDPGSGTLDGYNNDLKEELRKAEKKRFNPYETNEITIKNLYNENNSWITLGSEYYGLSHKQIDKLDGNKFEVQTLTISNKRKPLILYFKLHAEPIIKGSQKEFNLDRATSLFLTKFFEGFGLLEEMKIHDTDRYLHCKSNKQWHIIVEATNEDNVFQDDIIGKNQSNKIIIPNYFIFNFLYILLTFFLGRTIWIYLRSAVMIFINKQKNRNNT